MSKVAILTYDNAALFELGCATELFALPRTEFKNWYDTQVVCFHGETINTIAGLTLKAKQVQDFLDYDTLVIPSWPTTNSTVPPALAAAIQTFFQDGGRILSFCSGAFLLAELGLLNGRQATTHWRYAAAFQKKYPNIRYVDDVLYVYDASLGCSAGSSAALDLGLEVIRQDLGHSIANRVARRLVLSAHRKGGQAQYAEMPVEINNHGHFSNAISWASSQLAQRIEIDELARRAKMSRRSFDRKFKANFNLSPKEWLTHQRLGIAKELLEQSQHNMEQVAQLSGFNNATTMRHHFRALLGISPSQHKQQFCQNIETGN